MKNSIEKQKMLNGEMYNPYDPLLVEERTKARLLFQKFNATGDEEIKERFKVLFELIPNAGKGLFIEPPFFCDYGYNIKAGEHVFLNFNC